MGRAAWAALAAVAGCRGGEEDVLASLDGAWTGALDDGATQLALTATFEWSEDDALLFGSVVTQLPGEAEPASFAVRRWDTEGVSVFLDLTDEADGTRGMDLDGEVDGTRFVGDGAVTYGCPAGTCGYEGEFTLARDEGLTTSLTTAGTAPGTP